ncbi:MAG: hypothetical protein PHT54_05040 [Candidatus Nanoarchaeia archaeon]|nr:hypothetical protein [Candidatus Nanoarchaeia archaeon]
MDFQKLPEEKLFKIFLVVYGIIFGVGIIGIIFIAATTMSEFWLNYFSLTILISVPVLLFLLTQSIKKRTEKEKEDAIIEVFKIEISENEKQLRNMLKTYKNYVGDNENIYYFRDLTTIMCERVLKDVNPKTTKCHIIIERLRSSLTTLNNYNRYFTERPQLYPFDLTMPKAIVKQSLTLSEILNKKLTIPDKPQ